MIDYSKEVIHWLVSLKSRYVRSKVQIFERKINKISYFTLPLGVKFKSLEMNNQDRGHFPNVNFLFGLLKRLAFRAFPLIFTV
jgi:hypothetical protein